MGSWANWLVPLCLLITVAFIGVGGVPGGLVAVLVVSGICIWAYAAEERRHPPDPELTKRYFWQF